METSKRKKLVGSWWVLLSFIMFLSGLGIFVAGTKVKFKKWKIFGLGYILAEWVSMATGLVAVYMVIHLISIIHTFMIREEYFIRLEVIESLKPDLLEKERVRKEKLTTNIRNQYVGKEEVLMNVLKESDGKKNIKDVVIKDKVSDVTRTFHKKENVELVGINSCSEQELSCLPGVGIILAKKAMNIRINNGGFKSVDEFISLLAIKDYNIQNLKGKIICNKPEKDYNKTAKVTGRRIDI
ncbi:helix-hairpin-helix domain-containing protein [Clostridium estertheticum]|uniref:ComEA family DNA-binding protein n=1 Tax=Clostridium estertheticum TaxID=238834 RepID=UPI001C7D791E|nr:helix-hairpin-helix domain-containing protein [Clostridium estertheticum]MBX4261304.1 helix-hairpin-helix domain-containing protein [Clostridium estertheticum]WLC71658.1 helix-hairpin-helix domain-containing protein [Clostridium estertheticum]